MVLLRRNFIAALGAAIPLARGAAAAQENPQKPSPPSAPRLGALFPLSGADSLVGDEALRGVELAVDACNVAGGIVSQELVLIERDALDQNQAQRIAKAMIAGDAVKLLLGSGVSDIAYPGSAAAELAQLPYIELNAPADGITGRNFKFLLRSCHTTSMLAATAIAAAAKHFPGARIGLLFNTGATAGAVAAALLAQWQARGQARGQAPNTPPLLSIGYAEDAADLRDPVGRLQRAGAEIVLHVAGADDVLVFFQAMREVGWKPGAVIGCGDGYGLRETAFMLGAGFEGTLVSAAPYYPPAAAGIAGAYQAKYGMKPRSADSLTAYVGARLVFDALRSLNGDTNKLLDALRAASVPAGGLANGWGVAFDKSGQNTAAFATLQQWRNGALVTLG